MSYFTGIGTEGAIADIKRLRDVFVTQYHPFLDQLDAAVYPTIANRGGTAQNRWNPGQVFSVADNEKWTQSQYISHDIEQMLNSFQNRMMRSELKINVARIPTDKAEGQKQSVVEDYCHGILEIINAQAADAVDAQSHVAQMAMFTGRYGKICQFVEVFPGDDGWEFRWDFYHPRSVFHDFSSLPRVFVYERWYSLPQLENKMLEAYGEGGYHIPTDAKNKTRGELLRLDQLWVEERIAGKVRISSQCFVDDEAATDPRDNYDYTRRPFHVITMTGQGASFQAITQTPQIAGTTTAPYQSLMDHARPFYASILDNVRIHDDVRSMELQAMALAVNPVLEVIEQTRGTADGLEHQPIGPGTKFIHNQEVTIKAMEFLSKQMDNFTTPGDLKEERLHVWPSILWGATASANESNILYTSRIDEGENAIVAPALLVAIAYQRGFEAILHESRVKGVEITMPATASGGRMQGQQYMLDFKAKRDIPASFGLKITVPPMLPRDSLKVVQTYQLAVASGAWDEELAMRDILKHQDPHGVMDRRDRDRLRNSQSAQDIKRIQIMFQEADALADAAERETHPARKARLLKDAHVATLTARAEQARVFGQALGFQQEPQPRTPAPAQQPPEERGFESPPLQRALAGEPQPGGRPATTPQGGA